MTKSERNFFILLNQAVGSDFYVFPQIHLSSLLNEKIKGQNWQRAFYHINGKSVDFVLCSKSTLEPVLAIELDDASHNREDRRARDLEVERILANANFPLIRLKTSTKVTKEMLKKLTTL